MIRFDLCGMGVDLLRSCYRTKMRLRADSDEETEVQWFFCHPSAKVYPGYTRFGSGNWAHQRFGWTGPGEVEGASREWVDGSPVKTCQRGLSFLGPWEAIANGATSAYPPLPTTASGRPTACPGCPAGVGLTGRVQLSKCQQVTGPVLLSPVGVAWDVSDPSFPAGWYKAGWSSTTFVLSLVPASTIPSLLSQCLWVSPPVTPDGPPGVGQVRWFLSASKPNSLVWTAGLFWVGGGAVFNAVSKPLVEMVWPGLNTFEYFDHVRKLDVTILRAS